MMIRCVRTIIRTLLLKSQDACVYRMVACVVVRVIFAWLKRHVLPVVTGVRVICVLGSSHPLYKLRLSCPRPSRRLNACAGNRLLGFISLIRPSKMDYILLCSILLNVVSEFLALTKRTDANGVLDFIRLLVIHLHARFDCEVDVSTPQSRVRRVNAASESTASDVSREETEAAYSSTASAGGT